MARSASLDLLKWLAIVSMIGDHLRYLWPQQEWLFIPGRLAFPFFCLALAANVLRATTIQWRYLWWFLGFSLLSEVPYRWLDNGSPTLNVMPTLGLGLLLAWGVHLRTRAATWLALVAALVATLGNAWLMYGLPGVLLPAALLIALKERRFAWLAGLLAVAGNFTNGWLFQHPLAPVSLTVAGTAFMAVSLGLALLRHEWPGPVPPVGRWAWAFYPLHLAAISVFAHMVRAGTGS
ncbi:conjugal transfer protein TraX [Pseudomonas putida CSV86]|uniref:Conjugal transfer protein TraX n=1 Tax=Pseudomonas bharatica CSV86 TaxID=1005395 RepID=L1LX73_9PSED|nr:MULTISPECIES: TraX family protein [Pseudomonas]MDG9882658.1 conjugal transfer protein TraX [Pseudomonas sp. GD04058]NNJ16688.1 conjugal transfer protein TraX [Pseudomonas bharatica CSV86]